ncbi:hypothetical protein [uncultured Rothia sp.]|uniref:hypothetical protein n=1 Tax=uncultured Rothia sp. TaxID=316088 RepID=UPI00321701E7
MPTLSSPACSATPVALFRAVLRATPLTLRDYPAAMLARLVLYRVRGTVALLRERACLFSFAFFRAIHLLFVRLSGYLYPAASAGSHDSSSKSVWQWKQIGS